MSKVTNVRLRLPCSTYAYIEADLPEITTLAECYELADKMKKDEKDLRFNCQHLLATTNEGTSQYGKQWRKKTCPECGGECWFDFKVDVWQMWQFPIR